MGGGRTFWGVWGSGPNDVYVVAWDGPSGVVLRSDNGGAGWSQVKLGPKGYPYLTGISGASKDELWVVGFGVVLSTTDGGKTWRATEKATGAGAAGYGGVWAAGPAEAYLSADGVVFHTADGGATWSELRAPIGRTGAVWGVGGDVFVLGDGELLRSAAR
jgi:photosystem II stability/assembly factor-like uncharacterized protein